MTELKAGYGSLMFPPSVVGRSPELFVREGFIGPEEVEKLTGLPFSFEELVDETDNLIDFIYAVNSDKVASSKPQNVEDLIDLGILRDEEDISSFRDVLNDPLYNDDIEEPEGDRFAALVLKARVRGEVNFSYLNSDEKTERPVAKKIYEHLRQKNEEFRTYPVVVPGRKIYNLHPDNREGTMLGSNILEDDGEFIESKMAAVITTGLPEGYTEKVDEDEKAGRVYHPVSVPLSEIQFFSQEEREMFSKYAEQNDVDNIYLLQTNDDHDYAGEPGEPNKVYQSIITRSKEAIAKEWGVEIAAKFEEVDKNTTYMDWALSGHSTTLAEEENYESSWIRNNEIDSVMEMHGYEVN